MEYSDAAHKRAVEIEAALDALLECGTWHRAFQDTTNVERAKKALLPIYEPLVKANRWAQRSIGADYLEAAADRLETKKYVGIIYPVRDLRDWAKAERAIGS